MHCSILQTRIYCYFLLGVVFFLSEYINVFILTTLKIGQIPLLKDSAILSNRTSFRFVNSTKRVNTPNADLHQQQCMNQSVHSRISTLYCTKTAYLKTSLCHTPSQPGTHSTRNSWYPWPNTNTSEPLETVLHLPVPKEFHRDFMNPCWFSSHGTGNTLNCLPYFFLAGFPKSGTTDLFRRIGLHPQVQPPGVKEIHWWTWNRFRGIGTSSQKRLATPFAKYVSQFARAASCMNDIISSKNYPSALRLITGDGSPSTIFHNDFWRLLPGNEDAKEPNILIADHIRHYLPDARIIVVMRNPVTRMFSDYLYFWSSGTKTNAPSAEKFHALMAEALKNMTSCFKTKPIRTCVYDTSAKSRVGIGLYSVYLKDWLRLYSRSQIHVLRTEDYKQDPQTELSGIYRFLHLDDLPDSQYETILKDGRKNVGSRWSGRIEMLNETRQMLTEFYRPFNTELANILDDTRFLWEDLT